MTNEAPYVAAEPDTVTMYRDQTGELHDYRDDAVYANFQHDLRTTVESMLSAGACRCEDCNDSIALDDAVSFLKSFTTHHRALVRVLLGDRDPT